MLQIGHQVNKYPLLYPYARYKDEDEAYNVAVQRELDESADIPIDIDQTLPYNYPTT